MRTISKTLFKRIAAQSSEADLQGLTKVADLSTEYLEKNSSNVRDTDEFYSYSKEEFKKDVMDQMVNIMLRTADFYGVSDLKISEMHEILEKTAEDLIHDIRVTSGVKVDVGAYEPILPGEITSVASIEVSDE